MSQDRLAALAAAQVRRGPTVTISVETAALLEQHCNLRRLRVARRGTSLAVDIDLLALYLAAMTHDVSSAGTEKAPLGEMPPESKWMGSPAAAGLLGISPRTVRNAITRGDLNGRKVGGRWITTPEDIEQYRINRAA